MRVLLLRHGIAEDRAAWAAGGQGDAARPLTDEGRRRMKKISAALARLEPELALVATSPAVRARETALILHSALPRGVELAERGELAPAAGADAALKWLQSQRQQPAVALVGHEPNLSLLAGLLLAGAERSLLDLKKGGAALLDFPGKVAAGTAVLLWHLTPGQLRRIA